MEHRRAWPIALEVAKLADAPAPLPTPEQAAWETSQHEGISGPQQAAGAELAARIQNMSMADWARERGSYVNHQSLVEFLGGSR